MTQWELGKAMDKSQSWITRLEDPNQPPPTIPSLLQVAEAFDIDLDIRFAPFSRFLNSVDQMNPDSSKVPGFEDEYGTPKQHAAAESAAAAIATLLQHSADEVQKAMELLRGIGLHGIERSFESMMRPLAPNSQTGGVANVIPFQKPPTGGSPDALIPQPSLARQAV